MYKAMQYLDLSIIHTKRRFCNRVSMEGITKAVTKENLVWLFNLSCNYVSCPVWKLSKFSLLLKHNIKLKIRTAAT